MAKIVLVSGSTSRESVNTAVLETVRGILAELPGSHEAVLLPIAELPFYDVETERADSSDAVRAAKELVFGADAVVISTPSYNGEMPGVLKNALDWLSRPGGASPLKDRITAVTSASPGARGGLDAQPGLVGVLTRVGAQIVAHEPVAVGGAANLRNAQGRYEDPETVAALESLTGAVLAAVAGRAEVLV
ncbi:NADPH-dependent FMN reductase [Streptomyces sp. NPDC101118]|uniref:NADPH-dependent FMN reductase n=1 Tax=Streptomyces sp. NPDC101118 TaxID=3366109 RepID=UPI003825344C